MTRNFLAWATRFRIACISVRDPKCSLGNVEQQCCPHRNRYLSPCPWAETSVAVPASLLVHCAQAALEVSDCMPAILIPHTRKEIPRSGQHWRDVQALWSRRPPRTLLLCHTTNPQNFLEACN